MKIHYFSDTKLFFSGNVIVWSKYITFATKSTISLHLNENSHFFLIIFNALDKRVYYFWFIFLISAILNNAYYFCYSATSITTTDTVSDRWKCIVIKKNYFENVLILNIRHWFLVESSWIFSLYKQTCGCLCMQV